VAIGVLLLAGAAALALMAWARADAAAIALLALAGFAILGPYGLITGAVAHRLGGERAGATAVGLVDGAGYLAGTLSGRWIGGLAQDAGWSRAWWALAALTLFAALGSIFQACARYPSASMHR
jgi:sugar phosphate permease